MGVCGKHWKCIQLHACKLWCTSTRKTPSSSSRSIYVLKCPAVPASACILFVSFNFIPRPCCKYPLHPSFPVTFCKLPSLFVQLHLLITQTQTRLSRFVARCNQTQCLRRSRVGELQLRKHLGIVGVQVITYTISQRVFASRSPMHSRAERARRMGSKLHLLPMGPSGHPGQVVHRA